jgi:hypothetical protein
VRWFKDWLRAIRSKIQRIFRSVRLEDSWLRDFGPPSRSPESTTQESCPNPSDGHSSILTPHQQVSAAGSNWVFCAICNAEWQATVPNRAVVHLIPCPTCSSQNTMFLG